MISLSSQEARRAGHGECRRAGAASAAKGRKKPRLTPPHESAAPCESRSEGGQHHQISRRETPAAGGFVKSERDRGGRRVAIAFQVREETLPLDSQTLPDR